MSQVSTSIEILLKARAQGLEQVKAIEQAIDKVSDAQRGLKGQTEAAAASAQSQGNAMGALVRRAKELFAGIGVAAILRSAVLEASEAQRVEARTLAILQGQSASRAEALEKLKEAKEVAESISREIRTISGGDALKAAASVLAVGPQSADRLRQIVLASANISAATGQGLQETAEQIAKSLNGVVPRDLVNQFGELRRELERLGTVGFGQRLKRGALVDFGLGTLGGAAASYASTEAGRSDAASVRFKDALERLGVVVLPVAARALEELANAAEAASAALDGEGGLVQRLGGRIQENLISGGAGGIASALEFLGRRFSPDPGGNPQFAETARLLRELEANAESKLDALSGRIGARLGPGFRPRNPLSDDRSPRFFDDEQLSRIAGEQGLVDALTAALIKLREQYTQLGAAVNRDDPFKFFIDEPKTDADALFNLASAQARLRDVVREAAAAQEAFNQELSRARDLVEAGTIGQPKANEIIQAAAENLRRVQQELNFIASLASGDVERGLAFLRQLPDLPDTLKTLATIPEVGQAEQALKRLGDAADQAKVRFAGLADEIRERGRGPLAGFISDVAESKAGLEELPDVFRKVLLQIAAEAAANRILKALLGSGDGKDTGLFGGLLNSIGSILGFAQGGLVPGPDRGYDSGIIAARGGEYVVRPEAVRRPGVLPFLDSINRNLPGYASGGLVTRIAETGAAGGATGSSASLAVLPVVVADRDNAQRLLSGQNGLAVIDALRRNPGAARKALGL